MGDAVEGLTLAGDCLKYYKGFDIDGIEAHSQKINKQREDTVVERKKLAEETKKWNTYTDEQKTATVKPLLKLYQKEVDRLSSRAKDSEDGYLQLFGQLIKAPDFNLAIQKVDDALEKVRQTARMEIENQKLSRELAEFRHDFGELQNQEVTIRKLEAEIQQYQQKLEDLSDAKVKEAEKKLLEEHNTRYALLKEREEELTVALQQSQAETTLIKQDREILRGQLVGGQTRHESEVAGMQSQIDMLTLEIERMTFKTHSLEAENKTLSGEVKESAKTSNSSDMAELEMQVVQKELRIVEQTKQIKDLEGQLQSSQLTHASQVSSLTSQLQEQAAKTEELRMKIGQLPSAEEFTQLKSKLLLLRALEHELNAETGSSGAEVTVESVLRDKLRKLETDNVRLRTSMIEAEANAAGLQEKCQQLQETDATKDELILRLEEDLSKLRDFSPSVNPLASSPATASATLPRADDAGQAGQTEESDGKMLEIVSAQRDRFKARIATLEQDNLALLSQVKSIQTEARSLREDNVSLYQKIKYLQSYSTISRERSRTADLEAASSTDGVEDKYRSSYEDTVNPFTEFNKAEKAKRYKDLNPAEKILLNGSNFFLSNKYTRMFLFFYSVALHLLVFTTVYWLAHVSQDCKKAVVVPR